ncbi:uncharacterized protein AC631_00942 [Debaryomyces fabryi]|uniref:Uncharacterized protein n=1 Tax=Debaryomyces fabryi TaxID=58627 RepID=A0A0V1Q486_9ASCO|nr:uncharacterized protein AC631_00942 [Debaryomyces fabryi]KSA03304.1 hypothetical protein AC631_00942 [Debaryomyces fabryi]
MAPKLSKSSKTNQITIIKFKRNKSTYVLPLDLSTKASLSLKNFKASLATSIEQSGGLSLVEEDEETNKLDEDDIEVPKSEFIDNLENDGMMEDNAEDTKNIIHDLKADDLVLALPKDKTSPYDNNWIEITDDSSISSLQFNDYDIIAFKHVDDDTFFVSEAAYDE